MSGVEVKITGLERLEKRLSALANVDTAVLLSGVGAVVESQTKRRIEFEKHGPDGERWPEWSPKYAKTRHANQSLLVNEGHLRDSIQFLVTGDEVEVGTNLVYGATHQFGRDEIPARPFLGLGAQDESEIIDVVERFLDSVGRS